MTSIRIKNYGKINKDKVIKFTWDKKDYSGFEGDSLASALLANDVKIVGRSFKYHRPRGVMSCGVEESGALVTVGSGSKRDPNVRATTQELYEGLDAKGQNAFPSVNFDFGGINNYLGRFFAAGFYYKTFMGLPPFEWGKGTGIWMVFEKIIRKAAGMGKASREPDPDSYEHANDFCDVLVVGSGPAGVAAAQEAANQNLNVILIEQDSLLGGNNLAGKEFDPSLLQKQLESNGIRVLSRTTAFGVYDNTVVGALERVTDHISNPNTSLPRQRFRTIRAKHIILASGALERHIAFNNNDIPGVMTANAARHYLNRYGVLTGKNIVITTNNDSVYQTAIELHEAGSKVTILDSRKDINIDLPKEIELHLETLPFSINGSKKIESLDVCKVNDKTHKNTIICD
ncbi:2Fe-2S iron-sulfur cluster-binding protein, partial [Pelagibacteraceae bacterium]|nr:2Fe-2S iron-sulfur cluster-binding protein [Pelagibacteraceae bacterium]